MQWLLLSQHYVDISEDSNRMSVLEEVASSDQRLVQVLVSGTVSQKTMNLVFHGNQVLLDQVDLTDLVLQ